MTSTAPEKKVVKRRRRFEIDRRIPLVLIFGFVMQTGGALFWAGSAAERIATVERDTRANASVIERVVRLEERVGAVQDTLGRIEMKIDRISPSP